MGRTGHDEDPGQVIACGDTNVAADNLAKGLTRIGVRVVRAGNPATVRLPSVLPAVMHLRRQHADLHAAAGAPDRADTCR